ncbi:DUF1648 domain-containing protein [Chloroflexota bacterium]
MITSILIISGVIILGGVLASAVWRLLSNRRSAGTRSKAGETNRGTSFRWRYIGAPIIILCLSIILAGVFYSGLSSEVAIHFKLDGTADGWLSRELTTVLSVIPQLIFTLAAAVITWGIARLSCHFNPTSTRVESDKILLFMGNMVTLPQLIMLFAMLDIFSYNSLQRHIMPIWLFPLVVLALATIALAGLTVLAILKVRQPPIPSKE